MYIKDVFKPYFFGKYQEFPIIYALSIHGFMPAKFATILSIPAVVRISVRLKQWKLIIFFAYNHAHLYSVACSKVSGQLIL